MFRTSNFLPVVIAAILVTLVSLAGIAETPGACADKLCWIQTPFEILFGRYALPPHAHWLLNLAQQAGKAVLLLGAIMSTVYVSISAARHDFRIALSRKKRGHTIVCGLGETGMQVVRNMRASGEDIVVIDRANDTVNAAACDYERIPVIKGDAAHFGTLAAAGALNAKTIMVCTGDDAGNMDVALKIRDLIAARHRRNSTKLTIITEMRDQWLYSRLVDHDRQALGTDKVELQLFNTYDNAARLLIRSLHLPPGPEIEPGTFVVIGFGKMGQQLTLQLIRAAPASSRAKTRIIVVDRAAEQLKGQFLETYPALPDLVELQFATADISLDTPQVWSTIRNLLHDRPLLGVAVCLSDDHASLYSALSIRRLLDDLARIHVQVFVQLAQYRHLGQFAAALTRTKGSSHRLQVFGGLEELLQTDFLIKGKLDTLAMAFHDHWRKSPGARGSPADQPWDQLAETFKTSNRRRADLVPIALAQIGLRLAPAANPEILALTDDEIEKIARAEHRRWCIDRRLLGYEYGPARSDNPPRLPRLVDWERLAQADRDWNLEDVRALPQMIAAASLEIRRERKIPAYDAQAIATAAAQLSAAAVADEPCIVIADLDTVEGRAAAEQALQLPKASLWLVSQDYPDRLSLAGLKPIWEGATGWVAREQLRDVDRAPARK